MNIFEHLQQIARVMNEAQLDFALIGGLALGAHGVQRFTNDIDFLIDGTERLRLKQLLLRNGFELFFESSEVLQFSGAIALDVLCANRPISLAMLRDAKVYKGLSLKVLDAEQIIGLKIQAYCNDPKRELRDKADIAALIQANRALDWIRIKEYADLFKQWPVLENLRQIYREA